MVELTDKKPVQHSIPLFYEETLNASIKSIKERVNTTMLDVSDDADNTARKSIFRDT